MSDYAEPIERLIEEFRKLPGIGAKTAQRLAYSLLRRPREEAERLSERASRGHDGRGTFESGGAEQRQHLGRRGGRIHEPQPGPGGRLRLVDHAVDHALAADLLDVAERLFLDGRETAGNVALGGLRIGEIAGLMLFDHVLITIEHRHELLRDLGSAAALCHQGFAAGDFRSLAENQGQAGRDEKKKRCLPQSAQR